jgi:homocysteine S-methyltransferase
MINCAHPSHFTGVLNDGGSWLERVKAIRANASKLSHPELDQATELDRGDPAELADDYVGLGDLLPDLRVVGGCCGTDHHHVAAIVEALLGARRG